MDHFGEIKSFCLKCPLGEHNGSLKQKKLTPKTFFGCCLVNVMYFGGTVWTYLCNINL